MKKKIFNLMKRAVRSYCKGAALMYPTGCMPTRFTC